MATNGNTTRKTKMILTVPENLKEIMEAMIFLLLIWNIHLLWVILWISAHRDVRLDGKVPVVVIIHVRECTTAWEEVIASVLTNVYVRTDGQGRIVL